jgi:antitoxin CptB
MNDELAKIKWQCRRGSKELDLLLNEYLEKQYPTANNEEKARFIAMLSLDDFQLMHWLLSSRLKH